MTHGRRIAGMVTAMIGLAGSISVEAQTRSTRDAVTAYGARLNAKGQPADINQNRVNNRINSRLDTRLSLRIERYRAEADPTAAFATPVTDNSRAGTTPVTRLQPDGTTDRPQ